ncbi:hypothetical protein BC567DRAFT_210188 [Phyllosticta citribraziliensis]
MSFSTSSSPMAFTFGTHQSTPPFVFCREINGSSTLSRKRALADPSPSGPSRKKRRLRLSLTTSPLSLPFSTPRASSQPDRTSNHHRRTAILIFRPSQRLPQPPISASSPSPSSSCLLLRKAAVLNRVQQRMDAACQRNPNLRWEKEQRQERELLLKEGVQMRRMAALKDGLLSPVTSTRPVASPVNDVVPGHYSDPRRRLAATSHDVEDCERRCAEEKECTGGPQAAAAAAPVWFCSNTSYPSPPPSAVGLSNYDALDSEEEEKDDVAAPLPSMPQQHGDAATSIPESAGVVDEGMRDIFDFLTPPAMHRSFLSDFDDGQSPSTPTMMQTTPTTTPVPSMSLLATRTEMNLCMWMRRAAWTNTTRAPSRSKPDHTALSSAANLRRWCLATSNTTCRIIIITIITIAVTIASTTARWRRRRRLLLRCRVLTRGRGKEEIKRAMVNEDQGSKRGWFGLACFPPIE